MPSRSWRSLLVAVRDPSARQSLAIRKAAQVARKIGARITLFHAFSLPYPLPEPLPSDPEAILGAIARERRARLKALARPLRAAGIRVDCHVEWDFPPSQAIVRRVLQTRPDVVFAESHRHSTVARWFLASTDWDLIRECPCPVWFVKQPRLPARPLFLAAVDPSHANAKPSGLDDRLLGAATSLGTALRGRVTVLHVQDLARLVPPAFLAALPPATLEPSPAARAAAQAAVAALVRRHGIDADAALLRRGIPAAVIASTAKSLRAAVLVMGAVSRRGASTAFIGNTAEAVIDAASCDVLVVKPRGFRTTVLRGRPRLPRASGR